MINSLMYATRLTGGSPPSQSTITPEKRAFAKKKAQERAKKLEEEKRQEEQDREDLLDYIFNDIEEERQRALNKKDKANTIPTKLGADGDPIPVDPVNIPQWVRDAADPLGLGLLPTDEYINNRNRNNAEAADILDITPQTREQAR